MVFGLPLDEELDPLSVLPLLKSQATKQQQTKVNTIANAKNKIKMRFAFTILPVTKRTKI